MDSDQEWIADLETGSHLIFIWFLDGIAGFPTTFNKVDCGLFRIVMYILSYDIQVLKNIGSVLDFYAYQDCRLLCDLI